MLNLEWYDPKWWQTFWKTLSTYRYSCEIRIDCLHAMMTKRTFTIHVRTTYFWHGFNPRHRTIREPNVSTWTCPELISFQKQIRQRFCCHRKCWILNCIHHTTRPDVNSENILLIELSNRGERIGISKSWKISFRTKSEYAMYTCCSKSLRSRVPVGVITKSFMPVSVGKHCNLNWFASSDSIPVGCKKPNCVFLPSAGDVSDAIALSE